MSNIERLLKLTKALDKLATESDMPYILAVKTDGRTLRAGYASSLEETVRLIGIFLAQTHLNTEVPLDVLLDGVTTATNTAIHIAKEGTT